VLTTKQAAERLGRTPQTVRRYWKAGKLTGRQLDDRSPIEIDEASVQRFLDKAKKEPRA
jgi:predicted site-specific integrase-resolvase